MISNTSIIISYPQEQEYASKAKDTSTPEYALEKLRKEYAVSQFVFYSF